MPGIDVRLFEDGANLRDQVRLRDLLAREIHAHVQAAILRRLPLPRTKLLTRFAQDPETDRNDQSGVFSQRNKVGRIDEAAFRMLPANQSFEAGEVSVF